MSEATTPTVGYSLASLEEASGVSARTIRFYISQGLVDPPQTLGRGATYGATHLERLKKITAWKAEKLTLGEIKDRLEGRDRPGGASAPDVAGVPLDGRHGVVRSGGHLSGPKNSD